MNQITAQKSVRIPLKIQERSGVSVKRTVVSNGLPLPIGTVFSSSGLSILDSSGSPVEAGFSPLQKWQDGSWRFVLVNFLADLTAHAAASYELVIGERGKLQNKIHLTETETGFTIVTGPLKLDISTQGFNVLNRVWLDNSCKGCFTDETLVLDSHQGGITAKIDGITYTSFLGTVNSMEIERQDAVHAVIKAAGKLGSTSGLMLDYKVWIKAWAGSSEVEITFNAANKEGTAFEKYLNLQDLSLDLPLKTEQEGLNWAFGGKDDIHKGHLKIDTDMTASIYQNTSDSYLLNNGQAGGQRAYQCGKSDKSENTGWGDIRSGCRGMGAAYRWFWQTNPGAISVNSRGLLSVKVWPEEHEPLKFYTGLAKTTDIRLYFHDDTEPADTVGDRLKSYQKLTAAIAPSSWYCQDTGAVDARLVNLDPLAYKESEREFIRQYTDKFEEAWKKLLSHRDYNKNYAPGEDGYGFMNFGDGWEYMDDMQPPLSREVTWWGNNYYDHPHCFFLQFFRTGSLDYLDYALQHTYHMMDIDTANHDPVKGIPGNYKQCPGVMHIKRYTSPYKTEEGLTDNIVGGCDGHWHFQGVESLFEAYYTAGITPALERGLEATELPLTYDTLNFKSETRSIGHTLDGLAAAYRHTWNEKYLQGMNQVWKRVKEHSYKDHTAASPRYPYHPEYMPYVHVLNSPFQTGILLGGVYKYRYASPYVTGHDGIDNIACNTISHDIWGRLNKETGENSGWLADEQRWRHSDIMTVSAGWLNSLYPEMGFLPILKKSCENCLSSNFADRVKTFSQTFKYQWLTQFELAEESIRNRMTASFTAFPRKVKAGETVTFNNQSLGAVYCRWSFGDGEELESTEVNIKHTYKEPGSYDMELMVRNAENKEKSLLIKNYIEII